MVGITYYADVLAVLLNTSTAREFRPRRLCRPAGRFRVQIRAQPREMALLQLSGADIFVEKTETGLPGLDHKITVNQLRE